MGGSGNLPNSLGNVPSGTISDAPTKNLSVSRRIGSGGVSRSSDRGSGWRGSHAQTDVRWREGLTSLVKLACGR
jgi:hypothetical protein